MTERTTVGALQVGAVVLVDPDRLAFAKVEEGARSATVTGAPVKVSRKVSVTTDLGEIEAGPTARLFVVQAPEPTPPPALPPGTPGTASVNVDAAGRLTDQSVLRVAFDGGEVTRSVPLEVDEPNGHLAPVRLAATLLALGFVPVSPWQLNRNDVTCDVVVMGAPVA